MATSKTVQEFVQFGRKIIAVGRNYRLNINDMGIILINITKLHEEGGLYMHAWGITLLQTLVWT